MADQIALAAHPRVGSGKGEARALRRQGRVPAIAYGADLEATAISVDARELYHALRTEAGENAVIRLEVGGSEHLALARELQRHPVRREVLHVDFVTVNRRKKVTVDVPLTLVGEAPGSDEGGVVEQALHQLAIEVLPLEVPGHIEVDISELAIGDIVRVGDVELPEGVESLEDPDTTVVTVIVPQLEVPEEETPVEEALGEEEAEGATGDEAEGLVGAGDADGDEA